MRKIMLAAVVATLWMLWQPAEARDRGFSFRHFSGHAVPKLHMQHPGFKLHHGGFVGKPRAFKSRHFGHFDLPGFAFKLGHVPRLKPRHFGHFGQGGLVLKFSDGDFVLRLGHMPHFEHRHFSHRHRHHRPFFGFEQPPRFRSWPDRGSAFEDGRGLSTHRQGMPGSQAGQGGELHGGAPPEALLKQLEAMGFRHVPELLRSWDP